MNAQLIKISLLHTHTHTHEGVLKSFRTGRLERELLVVRLFANRCSCIAILWVSLVNFVDIILCVAFQRMFIVVVYFVIDSIRKVLDTPSYIRGPFEKFVDWQPCAAVMLLCLPLQHFLNFTLRQSNPVHTRKLQFFELILMFNLHFTFRSPKWSIFQILIFMFCMNFSFPNSVTCPAHLFLHYIWHPVTNYTCISVLWIKRLHLCKFRTRAQMERIVYN
jgi:hypothetical protein